MNTENEQPKSQQAESGLHEEAVAAIAMADEQYERGDFVEWRTVRDEMRRKYLGK